MVEEVLDVVAITPFRFDHFHHHDHRQQQQQLPLHDKGRSQQSPPLPLSYLSIQICSGKCSNFTSPSGSLILSSLLYRSHSVTLLLHLLPALDIMWLVKFKSYSESSLRCLHILSFFLFFGGSLTRNANFLSRLLTPSIHLSIPSCAVPSFLSIYEMASFWTFSLNKSVAASHQISVVWP